MNRNAFVPMAWVISDLNGEALRTLILISSYADAQTGECWPNNATLASRLGKTSRAVQQALQELKSAGLISMTEDPGKRRKIRIESPEWFDRPRRKPSSPHEENLHPPHEGNLHGYPRRKPSSPHEENLHPPHEGNLHPPNKNTPIEHTHEHSGGVESDRKESKPEPSTTTTNQNLEPFESGLAADLPQVRNGVEPFKQRTIEIVPTTFKPETRDKILAVLGHDGEQFARKITQAQADAGFPDWILDEAKRNKTPVKLAFHLLKTAWREGWISPKAEEDVKRAARRARLEALREQWK